MGPGKRQTSCVIKDFKPESSTVSTETDSTSISTEFSDNQTTPSFFLLNVKKLNLNEYQHTTAQKLEVVNNKRRQHDLPMLELDDSTIKKIVTFLASIVLTFAFPLKKIWTTQIMSSLCQSHILQDHLSEFNEYFVENFHSLIHQRTSGKNFNPEGLRDDAINIDNNRHDSELIKPFLLTKKYPYTKKNFDTMTKKSALFLLDFFQKIWANSDNI
nr:3443_t:CDS:2 [Entrophospora candida]